MTCADKTNGGGRENAKARKGTSAYDSTEIWKYRQIKRADSN
jgi:hypothetical protein